MTQQHIDLTEQINHIVGMEHSFTPSEVQVFIHALAYSRKLQRDVNRMIAETRGNYAEELELCH